MDIMDRLLLTVGFFLQALSVIWIIFLIRDRRAKKRFKEESLNLEQLEELYGISAITGNTTTFRGWGEYDNRNNPMPLRERYGGILEEKEDFIPKKKMKYHTLEEPIEYYFENEAGDEDEGCGCATVCDDCGFTTDYEYPF